MYYKKVYNIAYQMARNDDIAFEATQETFLKVHDRIGQLKDAEKFEAWLIKIVINKTYDLIKERKKNHNC